MKKLLLLLVTPLFLIGCNSNPATTANYVRLSSYQISGSSQVTHTEPYYYVYAEYELSQGYSDANMYGIYGEAKKTIYVMASFESYEKYGFKNQAQVSLYNQSTGTTTSATATHKGDIIKTKNGVELYYSVEIRTLKHISFTNTTDKVFNNSKLDELKTKNYYQATLTENETTISRTGYYSYYSSFYQNTTETFIDLGTTAVSYVLYTPPEN